MPINTRWFVAFTVMLAIAMALAVSAFLIPNAPAPTVVPSSLTLPTPAPTACPSVKPQIVAVLGLDERDNNYSLFRTDAIVLVNVRNNSDVRILALPRDLLVLYPDSTGLKFRKLNEAFFWGETGKYAGGGEQLFKDILTVDLGIHVDKTILVNFAAFKSIVDAVGGLDVMVPEPLTDTRYPTDRGNGYETVSFPAGPLHLNGDTALIYARIRHTDSDEQRLRRQIALAEALRDRVAQDPALVGKLVNTPNVWEAVHINVAWQDMLRLACLAQTVKPTLLMVSEAQAPVTRYPGVGSVQMPDRAAVEIVVHEFLGD